MQENEQTALHTQSSDKTDLPRGRNKNCCCQTVIMCRIQSLCTPMFSPVETGSAHRYSIKQSVLPRLHLFLFVCGITVGLSQANQACAFCLLVNMLCVYLNDSTLGPSPYSQIYQNLCVSMLCQGMLPAWLNTFTFCVYQFTKTM